MEQEAVSRAAAARHAALMLPPVLSPTVLPHPPVTPAALPMGPSGSIAVPPMTSDTEIPQTTEELMNLCKSFIDQLRSGSAPWLLQRLNNTYGTMPANPSDFSYWMALVSDTPEGLVMYLRYRLSPSTSTKRLDCFLFAHPVSASSLSHTG
jgi:hypothetical protein